MADRGFIISQSFLSILLFKLLIPINYTLPYNRFFD